MSLKKQVIPLSPEEFIIRFHNLDDTQEIEVNVTDILSKGTLEETSLTGNQLKSELIDNKL